MLEEWGRRVGARVTTFVIPNVFGPFCRPRYNSVVATFCHLLNNGEEPVIQADNAVPLIYVLDLVELMRKIVLGPTDNHAGEIQVPPGATITVSRLLSMLMEHRDSYVRTGVVPALSAGFEVALFNTFRSYIDPTNRLVKLKVNRDDRGYLCETVKSHAGGQTFFSVTKPGITRGNHYHLRKIERFTVVQGEAVIKLRRIGTEEIHEYHVTGSAPSFVDMPVLCTHNITNVGSAELLTLFWSNEMFDPADPDTYPETV